jgi:hypothetical protein
VKTGDKVAIMALVCSIVLPVLSFHYLDQQIKGFEDRQLVYGQKTWTDTSFVGPEGCWGIEVHDNIAPNMASAPTKKLAGKSKPAAKGSSKDCRLVSEVKTLALSLKSVGKLPVSHVSISILFQGPQPPERVVSVKITPPVNVVKTWQKGGLVLKFDDSLSLPPGTDPVSVEVDVTTVEKGRATTPPFEFIGAVIFSDGKNNPGLIEEQHRPNQSLATPD